jgi:hypothetical protein
VFGVATLVAIVVYNQYFIGQWVGSRHYGGEWITIISAVNAFLLSLISLWGWCFSGTARLPLLLPAFLVQTFINVSLSVVFTSTVGLVGPLLGTLTGFVTVSLWYLPRQLYRVFGTPPGRLIKAVGVPILLGLPYTSSLWFLATTHAPAGWIEIGAHMGAAVLVYLAATWVFMLNRTQRTQVTHRLTAMLGTV